ncbi:MAG: hypothetical protein K0S33_1768 [Bacteroidetes bacterium]|jgi:hypothetical protein|nr:hypothetical protein [Bacteroidota bacterium]
MASTTETGHAKNIVNFEDLISYTTGYGTAYNPSNNSLVLAALQAKHTNALAAVQAVKAAKIAFDNATNARERMAAELKQLSARLVNGLSACGATEQTLDDARTIHRKVTGRRAHSKTTKADAGKVTEPGDTTLPVPPRTISASQQSYDALIDNFEKLVGTVGAEPLFAPNETDLQVASLNTFCTNYRLANTAVINAHTPYSNLIIARNVEMYAKGTGLVDLANGVKKYVKSVFGVSSPQYRQLSALLFKNLSKE